MTEDDEKYEQPTVDQKIKAVVIYVIFVFVCFCLLIGLANYHEPVKEAVKVEVTE